MSLRERLRQLRPAAVDRSTPLPDTPAPEPEAAAASPPQLQPLHIGRDVTLIPRDTSAGAVLCAETFHPVTDRRGRLPIGGVLGVPESAWRRVLPVTDGFPIKDAVFIDLETTGLSRGTGTYAFLIGVGRFAGYRFRLRQYFLRDFHEESAALAALLEELQTARAIVTFNGRTFDWPLLETRAVMNRMRLPRLPHLDLLHPARRLWQETLGSCRLTRLEEEILGVERHDDVPGEQIPQLYFTFLETGDAEPLADVIVHNQLDILSLAALAGYIGQAAGDPLTAAPAGQPLSGAELYAVGKMLVENIRGGADVDLGSACLLEALRRGLPDPLKRRCYQLLAALYRRTGQFDEAVALLRAAVKDDSGSPWAHIELAKHYEHRIRDFATARDWSLQALDVAMRRRTLKGLGAGQHGSQREGLSITSPRRSRSEHDVDGIVHRIRRLERRLRRESGER